MNWSNSDINHIKVSLNRCSVQGLANELGTAKNTMEKKIREIQATDRISNLTNWVKERRHS